MHCLSFGPDVPFFLQPIICAVLSLPIFGVAQLSYRFEPPPVTDPPKQNFPSKPPIIVYSYVHCVAWAVLSILPAVLILLYIKLACYVPASTPLPVD